MIKSFTHKGLEKFFAYHLYEHWDKPRLHNHQIKYPENDELRKPDSPPPNAGRNSDN